MVVIGRIDREIFRCIAEDIVTEEVVMTDNQLEYILQRHPEVFPAVLDVLRDILEIPTILSKINIPIPVLLSGSWKPVLKVCGLYCESVLRKTSRATKIRSSPVGKSANAGCKIICAIKKSFTTGKLTKRNNGCIIKIE